LACKKEDLNKFIIVLLLSNGADPSVTDNDGKTVLHYISQIKGAKQQDAVTIGQILLKTNINLNIADKKGYTALHYASGSGNETLVEMFLKARAKVDEVAKDKTTPLYHAATLGNHRITKKLLLCGADEYLLRAPENSPSLTSEEKDIAYGPRKAEMLADWAYDEEWDKMREFLFKTNWFQCQPYLRATESVFKASGRFTSSSLFLIDYFFSIIINCERWTTGCGKDVD